MFGLWFPGVAGRSGQNKNQNRLLVMRPKTIIHQDLSLGELVPSPHREENLVTESSPNSEAEIRESLREFQSLIVWGKKLDL